MATTTPQQPAKTPVKKLNFAYPFRKAPEAPGKPSADFADQHEFHRLLRKEPGGAYAVSRKGLWHGGIHITEAGAGQSLDLTHGVRCMADGEVVAWRVNRTYLPSEIPEQGDKAAFSAKFSTGFALVRHVMEFPKDNTLTFFSLYMHLQDFASYEADKALPRPSYWITWLRVTDVASDKPDASASGVGAPAEQTGLRVRTSKPGGTILGILPRGAQFSLLKRDGNWGQIESVHVSAMVPPKVGGYVAPDAAEKGWIYLGKESGAYVVETVMPDTSLDRVVAPPKPVPVNAGDIIGHIGRFDSLSERVPARMVHLEMFCGDSIQSFIETSRAWVTENGAKPKAWEQLELPADPTILRIDRRTTLYKNPNQQGQDAPLSDVVQAYTLAELGQRNEKPHTETSAGSDGEKMRWWKVDSADVRRQDITGWVREQNFAGGRISREFAQKWVDFEILHDPHDSTHTIFASTQAYVDYATGADVPNAGAIDKLNPLMQAVCRQLYATGDGSQAANDLCVASQDAWAAMRASRLIVKHESEWANPDKWNQLITEIEKKVGPDEAHEAERKRIQALAWWDAVKEDFPALPAPQVFHIHPIGIIGNFDKGKFQFTLTMMHRLFPHANRDALQEVADELNAHLQAYKLDTPLRRAHFFAKVMQETGSSLTREEGFIWKASSLIAKFSYFHNHPDQANAHGYHHVRPIKADGTSMNQVDFEAIANGAYGGRAELGNGNYASGDGWRYRGRGLKQLTGRANYRAFTKWHVAMQNEWPQEVVDFETNPDLLVQPKYAARSAAYFWVDRNLPEKADQGETATQVNAITEVVNLHTDSYAARVENFNSIYSGGYLN